jgi:biotin-dependent carboxylase-like uncharacterized protein
MTTLLIDTPGPLTTIQDNGRFGYTHLGVGRSGAVDRASFDLANRLVGNLQGAAALEVTMGGLIMSVDRPAYVAVTGADAHARVDGVRVGHNAGLHLMPGQTLTLATPRQGVRTYVAVRGGLDVEQVLGSRSTDTLAGLGPRAVVAGERIRVGEQVDEFPSVDSAPMRLASPGVLAVEFRWGPRDSWLAPQAAQAFRTALWKVGPESNRVGVRLIGPPLQRTRTDELPSEGVALGSIQAPPSGPIVFLGDHPVTGGYPVIGVVEPASLDAIAQLRPGQGLVFVPRR